MEPEPLRPTVVVHSRHSHSPSGPFNGAIQQLAFVHGAGDFEGSIFSLAPGVRDPLALVVVVVVATNRASIW